MEPSRARKPQRSGVGFVGRGVGVGLVLESSVAPQHRQTVPRVAGRMGQRCKGRWTPPPDRLQGETEEERERESRRS
jgi:hypothetical protein